MHIRRNSSQLDFNSRRLATANSRYRRLACLAGIFLVWLLLSYALSPDINGRGSGQPKLGCVGSANADDGRFYRPKGAYVPPAAESRSRLGEGNWRRNCGSLYCHRGHTVTGVTSVISSSDLARCRLLYICFESVDPSCWTPCSASLKGRRILLSSTCLRDSPPSRLPLASSSRTFSITTGCTVRHPSASHEEQTFTVAGPGTVAVSDSLRLAS